MIAADGFASTTEEPREGKLHSGGCSDAPDDRRSYRNSNMKIILLMLLIVSGFSFANELKPCRYQHINELEPIQVDSCISFTSQRSANDSDAFITKEVALTANYNSNNIAYLYSEFGPFYFIKSGKARKTVYYDNGPDYFQEGLARTNWNNKIGFFDKELNIIIRPAYDFAFPFKNSVSMVCNGCVKKSDGEEHTTVVKGSWGFIDKSGNIVIPIMHTKIAAIKALNEAKLK